MKNFILTGLLILSLIISCKDDEVDCSCNDLTLNIAYTIAYSTDSTYVYVTVSDASSNIPEGSIITTKLNGGEYQGYFNRYLLTGNGKYSIITHVKLPDGLLCSKTEEFNISGIKN